MARMHPPKTGRPRRRIFLREWRHHRNKTQEQLAQAVGITKVHVSNVERGERQYTQELLEAFAGYLECEPWQILNVDPTAPGAVWSIWEAVRGMTPAQQEQAAAVIRALTEEPPPPPRKKAG